jgi:hypothetical protein
VELHLVTVTRHDFITCTNRRNEKKQSQFKAPQSASRLPTLRIKIKIFSSMITCLVYTCVFEFVSGNFEDRVNGIRL